MKNLVCFLLLTCCLNVFAQKQDLVSAIMDFEDQEFETAKSAIDNATLKLENGKTLKPKRMSDYYYYRGNIYLKIFENAFFSNFPDADFALLEVASTSFLNDLSNSGTNAKDSKIQLNRCARLYHDAGYENRRNNYMF